MNTRIFETEDKQKDAVLVKQLLQCAVTSINFYGMTGEFKFYDFAKYFGSLAKEIKISKGI